MDLYARDQDDITRMSWLDTDLIKIEKVMEGLWRVTIKIPCRQLTKKDGKYSCKKYDSPERPEYCKTYPANFADAEDEVIKLESKKCKLIKEEIRNGKSKIEL